jgi:hypothetical protein
MRDDRQVVGKEAIWGEIKERLAAP